METKNTTVEQLSKFFCQPLHIAAALNKMSIADFKKYYNAHGIKRWPHNKHKNKSSSSGNMKGFQDFQIVSTPKYLPKFLPHQEEDCFQNTLTTPKQKHPALKEKIEDPPTDSEFEAFCKNLDFESSVRNEFEDYFCNDESLFK
jgi:hypothetical protein